MIYVISKLWTDAMENEWSAAQGYKEIGWVRTEEEAKTIAGSEFITGSGWPFEKGKQVPVYSYYPLPELVEDKGICQECGGFTYKCKILGHIKS